MNIEGEEQLRKLEQWVRSPEFTALVGAYQDYQETGTIGRQGRGQRMGVLDERGILRPERFREYMGELQSRVGQTLRSEGKMYRPNDQTLQILQDTLQNMWGSDNFGDATYAQTDIPLKQLFDRGREMGKVLGEYAAIAAPKEPAPPSTPTSERRR